MFYLRASGQIQGQCFAVHGYSGTHLAERRVSPERKGHPVCADGPAFCVRRVVSGSLFFAGSFGFFGLRSPGMLAGEAVPEGF